MHRKCILAHYANPFSSKKGFRTMSIAQKNYQMNDILPAEEWLVIPGYDDHYEISNYGRARSYWNSSSKNRLTEPRYLKPQIESNGYIRYGLLFDGRQKHFSAHRLVAMAFLGASELVVNHKDGDRCNNFVGNLEWVTHGENLQHAKIVLGRQIGPQHGELHHSCKLTDNQVAEIRRLARQGISRQEIASQFGIHIMYVSYLKRGHTRLGGA